MDAIRSAAQIEKQHREVSGNREDNIARSGQSSSGTNTGIGHGNLEEVEIDQMSRRPGDGRNTSAPKARKQKVRLDRFGRVRPPRKSRHAARTEDDHARDAMVEELLHESRFDNIYSDPTSESVVNTEGAMPGQDEAADERLAEEFRREFLANLEEKNMKKQAGPPGQAGAGGPETKGPKLGGSRSQRAAMRAVEEKAAKGKK